MKITLIVQGDQNGFGSYALIQGKRRQVTHLDFGRRMSVYEAEQYTLLKALESFQVPARVELKIQCTNQRLCQRIKEHGDLSQQLDEFAGWTITRISPDQAHLATGS